MYANSITINLPADIDVWAGLSRMFDPHTYNELTEIAQCMLLELEG